MYPRGISAFVRALALVGAFPTRRTPRESLVSLIRSLHPLESGHDLLRLGGTGDGGYLVPDDLDGIASCWSAGIGRDCRFECACGDLGMEVFLTDGSVTGPPVAHPRFHFTRNCVGVVDDSDTVTLETWTAPGLDDGRGDMLLKLDIEGAEYDVLLAAPRRLLARCRLIVVEFHRLDHLWSKPFFDTAANTFAKLLQTHACTHIHPNNHDGVLRHRGIDVPPTMEFTFERRDRLPAEMSWRMDFPHRLDEDNSTAPPLVLPRCWYRHDASLPGA